MPMTRQDRGKDKQVDMPIGEGMSKSPPDQASQGGAESEFATQASPVFPAPEELGGREGPAKTPVNDSVWDLSDEVQILTRIVVAWTQGQIGPTVRNDDTDRAASRRTQGFPKLDPPTFTR